MGYISERLGYKYEEVERAVVRLMKMGFIYYNASGSLYPVSWQKIYEMWTQKY